MIPEIITILLVEDDPFMRDGTQDFLTRQGFAVIEAGSAHAATQLARTHLPDVAVVDIVIPPMASQKADLTQNVGVELIRRLKHIHPTMGIVLFSAYANRGARMMALVHDGLRGLAYTLKGNPAQELLQAIRAVREGKVLIDPEVANWESLASDLLTHLTTEERPWVLYAVDSLPTLTPGERRIARYIAASYTIAGTMQHLDLKRRTVENTTTRIYEKLGLDLLKDEGVLNKRVVLGKAFLIYELQGGTAE